MADYFLVHDRRVLEEELGPPLAAAWRRRSFAPCLGVCRDWVGAARAYAGRYHVDPDDLLLLHVGGGLQFDRACWRTLAGELLLVAATEIPEFPTSFDSLVALLDPQGVAEAAPRPRLPPIRQALAGSRDLTFGLAAYRPEHAGYNDAADTARLAAYLASVRPGDWGTADLPAGLDLADEEERAEELAFAREWFAALADLYGRSAAAGRVLVLESIF
jgi:hypothetical protein